MNDAQLVQLQSQHYSGQVKYTYFLLAAAASAIALSVQRTSGQELACSMVPLGLAIILWGLSFYFGCRGIHWVQGAMQSNYMLLELHDGRHPNQPETDEEFEIAEKVTRQATEEKIKRAEFFDVWQLRLLLAGAVLFLTWHILEMALLTEKP